MIKVPSRSKTRFILGLLLGRTLWRYFTNLFLVNFFQKGKLGVILFSPKYIPTITSIIIFSSMSRRDIMCPKIIAEKLRNFKRKKKKILNRILMK